MNEIINSLELKDIIKELKNKNYLTALNKTKSLNKKYPSDKILIKIFASIYFNIGQWESALKYYKILLNLDNEKFKILCNIGVSYFKLGKINKSIKAFSNSFCFKNFWPLRRFM